MPDTPLLPSRDKENEPERYDRLACSNDSNVSAGQASNGESSFRGQGQRSSNQTILSQGVFPVSQFEGPSAVGFTQGIDDLVDASAGEVILSDFSDKKYWVPFGHSMADALSFNGSGGMVVKTSGARIQPQHIACGVKARFKLFPSLAGLLQFRFKISAYTQPADLSASEVGLVGIALLAYGERFELVGTGYVFASTGVASAFIKGSKNDLHSAAFAVQTPTATGAFSTIEFQITYLNSTALTPPRYMLGTVGPPITVCKKSVNGGAYSDFETAGQGPWGWDHTGIRGQEFSLGLFCQSRNQNFGCTFDSFTLASGLGIIG